MLGNSFSKYARTLGMLGLFSSFLSFFWFAFLFGSLAIILAVLSKGREKKLCKNAKIGMLSGISALVIQFSLIAFTLYSIIYIPEFREQFQSTFYEMYQQMYGVPFQESFPDFFNQTGISF